MPMLKKLALGAVLACAALAALATPAAAKAPCWKTLINDWYDGRIDRIYPIGCYRTALKHLPEDVQTYSSARDDISRALAARIAGKGNGPQGGPGGKGTSGPGGGSEPGRHTDDPGPVKNAIKNIGPDSADAVPIPLIVLGALAVLLLALGSAGFLARRFQARRTEIRPATGSQSQKP